MQDCRSTVFMEAETILKEPYLDTNTLALCRYVTRVIHTAQFGNNNNPNLNAHTHETS